MKPELDVYPYDVTIAIEGCDDFVGQEYLDRLNEAFQWLEDMKLMQDKHWRFNSVNGREPTRLEFKKHKDAMIFKMAFG